MKKIIILGGSGFVGKSLKDYLKKNKKYKLITYSRFEKKNILKITKLPKSDLIFYFIRNNKISQSLEYFDHFKKLLSFNKEKTKILFMSSGAVYGFRNKKKKFNESEIISIKKLKYLKNNRLKYAKEKIFLEKKFKMLAKNGYKVSIARGFSFVGKNILNYNYFISQMVKNIFLKKNIVIKNEKTFRSYMHENDMCKWLIKIGNVSSINCPIYNVGSDQTINITKLAKEMSIKYNVNLIVKKPKKIKYDFYVPSTSLVKRELKLKTSINIKHAIKQLINNL